MSVPIVGTAVWHHSRVQVELGQLGNEAAAVRWMAEADRFVNAAQSPPLPSAAGPAGAQLAALERASADLAASVPSTVPATGNMRAAAERLFAGPDGSRFVSLEQVSGRSLDAVSDGSRLSFESHVALADVGDALDNSYYRLFAPVEAASATMDQATKHGEPTVRERILVAGQLALARGFADTLANDMEGAFGEDPKARLALEAPWHRALGAADALEHDLDSMLIGRTKPEDALRLTAERRTLARSTATLVDLLARQSVQQIERIESDVQASLWAFDLLAAALVTIVFLLAAWAAALIARRDRRELARLQNEARTMAAELGQREAEHARMLTEAQFDAVFDRSQMGIALLDSEGAVIKRNPSLLRMLGEETPGLIAAGDARFRELLHGDLTTFQFEIQLNSASGQLRWSRITVSSVDVPRSEEVSAIAIVEDITERKALDDHFRHAAVHDHLTSLPNRMFFIGQLEELLRNPIAAASHAVFFVDLDRFKMVNDTMGHRAGNRTLIVAAERLRAATRPGDLVARLHGDEFAILAGGIRDAAGAAMVAERIRQELLAPMTVDAKAVSLSASIGIVDDLSPYPDAEQVLRDADLAMYAAKKLGRDNAVAFNAAMHDRMLAQMRMMTELPAAISRREFRVAYQPIVELDSGAVCGFEALMRWTSPTLGTVPPTDFIPVAEESDVICTLGRFALEESCALLRRLDSLGLGGLHASVNLSVAQLRKGDVVRDVRDALARSAISAPRLTLELTESGLLETKAQAAAALDELRRLGVKICIDDFGTGYSSLRYLHELPIDTLKIDRSFVSGDGGALGNMPIVQMLLTLARHLGVDVVAEGVETEQQRHGLVERACGSAQGYLFAKPLFEEQFIAWLSERASDQLERIAEAG